MKKDPKCSLPVKTGKFTFIYAASTSPKIHANGLQPHVNLLENSGYCTANFTCESHTKLSTIKQNYLLLLTNPHRICRQKFLQRQTKIPATERKITTAITSKTAITRRVTSSAGKLPVPLFYMCRSTCKITAFGAHCHKTISACEKGILRDEET